MAYIKQQAAKTTRSDNENKQTHRKRTFAGNHSLPDFLGRHLIQRKAACACGGDCPACQEKNTNLPVSQPNDASEIEADRIADKVMRASDREFPPVKKAQSSKARLQRKCGECKDEEIEEILRKENGGLTQSGELSHVSDVLKSGGTPLSTEMRAFFEPRFGYDFTDVRVFTDDKAAVSAKAVSAKAYTLGNNVVFGQGNYAPESDSGKQLLAHELAHIVQNTGKLSRKPEDEGGAKCFKKPREGYGENIKPPLEFGGTKYVYTVWGKWQTGDTEASFTKRAFENWVTWRYGNVSADVKKKVVDYMLSTNFVSFGISPTVDCFYGLPLELSVYAQTRVLSGEVAREREAQKAKEEEEKKAREEAAAQAGVEKETEVPPEDAPAVGGATEEKKPETPPGGLGEKSDAEAKPDAMPVEKLKKDFSVLTDSTLASHYLKLLEHYTKRSISNEDKTMAADGLTEEEIGKIVGESAYRRTITSLYTQGYREYQAAGGKDAEPFFALIELIVEQFTRGNPTATHNQLKIGKGKLLTGSDADKEELGILERSSGLLFYNAQAIPLPGFGGVGFRDKGYIASRADDKWGFNIANIEDEGLKQFLNSLRQTFGDPARMAVGGAEVYFNNIEMVNARVQKNLGQEVWNKFQEMLPYFIGFLAGHALSTFLMRVPNPAVAAVGAALKGLLVTAEYVMQIEFGAGAMERLMKAAYHLSRVEKNDKDEFTQLSEAHIAGAAQLLREMVAEIAAMFATMALGKLIRAAKGGEKKAKIDCTHCDLTGESAKEAKSAEKPAEKATEKAAEKPAAETKVKPPDAAQKAEILEIFAEGQSKASERALGEEAASQHGMGERPKPGGKPVPEHFDVGNFSHKYAEQLIPSSKLPRGLEPEFKIPEANRRVDRIDWKNGKVYEIKPNTKSQMDAGQKQVDLYVHYLNQHFPLPGGQKWKGEVVTYDKAAVRALLKSWGWLK